MTFCCFNPFPWPTVSARPDAWPFPNCQFDPATGTAFYREQVDQLIFAEECGFDWLAVGEDHMTAYGLTPNPNLVLSIVSYCTDRVKLAVFGAPLPLLNPIRVAEEAAMLDVMSGGRLVMGFIRGVPQNYAAYNVDPDESRGRFEEASNLILRAWTDPDVFSWHGTYYNFPNVSIWPRPLQTPHPPLVYSANSVSSAVVAAKCRATIGTIHLYSRSALRSVREAIDAYKEQARQDGWEAGADRFMVGLPTCIANTDAKAEERLNPALNYQFQVLSGTYDSQKREIAKTKPGYGFSPVEEHPPTLNERLENHMVLCGSPRTVVDQIEWLRGEIGIGIVAMHCQVGNMPNEFVTETMSLFRDGVLPHFRAHGQNAGAPSGVGPVRRRGT